MALENNWLFVERNANFVDPEIDVEAVIEKHESEHKIFVNWKATSSAVVEDKQPSHLLDEDVTDALEEEADEEISDKELFEDYIQDVESYIQDSPYWHKYSKLKENRTFLDDSICLLVYCEDKAVREKVAANILMHLIHDKTDD